MARENPTWGEERIAAELLLKLNIRFSPRTVRRYMPLDTGPRKRVPSQRWMTFVRNHAQAIVACDFFIVVTASFRVLYVFVLLEVGTRRIAHFNVTVNPTATWTLQQFREVMITKLWPRRSWVDSTTNTVWKDVRLDLQTRIGNRQCFAGDGITHLELVFGVGAFPHANEKFSNLTPNVAAHSERVTQIRVTALIERTAQSNPRLHGSQHTVPGYFLDCISPQGGQAARLSKLYS